MMLTKDIAIWRGDVQRTYRLPAKYVVCTRCEGTGKHLNPAFDEHGISQEEMDDDPDFFEDYKNGVYDVRCEECGGERVQLVIATDKLSQGAKEIYSAWKRQRTLEYQERASEIRFGY